MSSTSLKSWRFQISCFDYLFLFRLCREQWEFRGKKCGLTQLIALLRDIAAALRLWSGSRMSFLQTKHFDTRILKRLVTLDNPCARSLLMECMSIEELFNEFFRKSGNPKLMTLTRWINPTYCWSNATGNSLMLVYPGPPERWEVSEFAWKSPQSICRGFNLDSDFRRHQRVLLWMQGNLYVDLESNLGSSWA